jgi:hypothetical protein
MDCPRTIKGQTAAEVGDARDALVSPKFGDALDTFFVGKLEMISFGGRLSEVQENFTTLLWSVVLKQVVPRHTTALCLTNGY